MDDPTKQIANGVLDSINIDGTIPEFRVPNAIAARAIYSNALVADLLSRKNRAVIQAELDGTPPYNPQSLAAANQSFRTNSNFRIMEGAHDKILTSCRDAVNANPCFVSVKTKYGTLRERTRYNETLSRELTKMLFDWNDFTFQSNYLHHNSLFFGFGIAYFPDKESWTFRAGGLDEFQFPRDVHPKEDEQEIVFASHTYRAHELYAKIRDEETAEDAGWDVQVVKSVLANHARNLPNQYKYLTEIERMLKNSDLTLSDQIGTSIDLVSVWVKEFDGSITHGIFYANSMVSSSGKDENKDFLYLKPEAYSRMSEAFAMFPANNGTNGFVHSLRGLGSSILPHANGLNRLISQAHDSSMDNLSTMLSVENEPDRVESALTPLGPYTLVGRGYNFVPKSATNIDTAAGAVMSLYQQQILQKIGEIETGGEGDSQSRTQFEAEVRFGNASKLNASVLDNLIKCYTKLLRELVKRVINPAYPKDADGYEEIQRLKKRLEGKNVPLEALYGIDEDEVTAESALGNGSPIQRKIALRNVMALMPNFDSAGRKFVVRAITESEVGQNYADQIIPAQQEERGNVVQTTEAILENQFLSSGTPIPVLPLQDHEAHAKAHSGLVLDLTEQGSESKEMMGEVAPVLQVLVEHFNQHLGYLEPQADQITEYSSFVQVAQQAKEIVDNGMKHLEAMQKKEAQQAESEGGVPQEGDPEKIEKTRIMREQADIDMQIKQEKAQQEADIKLAKARQDLAIKDSEIALKFK